MHIGTANGTVKHCISGKHLLLNTHLHEIANATHRMTGCLKDFEFCRRILEGDTRILPWRLGSKTPCEYCEYRDSCGFDRKIPGYEYKELLKMDKAEFWKKIEEEDKEENHGG